MTDIPIIETEIEPIKPGAALYLCDRRVCDNCYYPLCKHTTDISHAVNFEKILAADIGKKNRVCIFERR